MRCFIRIEIQRLKFLADLAVTTVANHYLSQPVVARAEGPVGFSQDGVVHRVNRSKSPQNASYQARSHSLDADVFARTSAFINFSERIRSAIPLQSRPLRSQKHTLRSPHL